MTEYCVFVMFEGKSLVYIKPGTFAPKMQYVQQVSFFTGNVEERNSSAHLLMKNAVEVLMKKLIPSQGLKETTVPRGCLVRALDLVVTGIL